MEEKTIKAINEALTSFARKRTNGGYNRIQDLVQDVWLEVFKNGHKVCVENIPYFKGILMKKFLMKLRRSGWEQAFENCPEVSREESARIVNKLDLEMILDKLNNHKDGWIAIAFYFEGKGLKELSQKYKINYNTLKARLNRLMHEIKDKYAERSVRQQ